MEGFALKAVLAICLALPAHAGDFAAPQGCESWMTVQQANCRVSNYFRCAGDPPGDQWRAVFGKGGPTYAGRIDAEAQWLESITPGNGLHDRLEAGAADLSSFTGLLAKGRDDFDFVMAGDDGTRIRYRGHDRLTGRTAVIDGVTLRQTAYEIEEMTPDGTVTAYETGNQFIHAGWRRFFGGPSERTANGRTERRDSSPVQFVFPGEAGFAATQPVFGCDAVMSRLGPEGVIHVRH